MAGGFRGEAVVSIVVIAVGLEYRSGPGLTTRGVVARDMASISEEYLDLFEGTAHGVVATIEPDGAPHQTVVWVDHADGRVLINTARGRRKVENLERDARVDVLVIDPQDPERYVSVRGECVAITEEGADEHDEALWRRYKGREKPEGLHADQTRVILEIEPRRVFERDPP